MRNARQRVDKIDDLAQLAIQYFTDSNEVALRGVFDTFEANTDEVSSNNIQSVYVLLRVWATAASTREEFFKSLSTLPSRMADVIFEQGGWGPWDVLKCWCRIHLKWTPMLAVFEKVRQVDNKLALMMSSDAIIPYALSSQPHGLAELLRQPKFLLGFTRIHEQLKEAMIESTTLVLVEDPMIRDAVASTDRRFIMQCDCLLWGVLSDAQEDAEILGEQLAAVDSKINEHFQRFLSERKVQELPNRRELLFEFDDFGHFVGSSTTLRNLKCWWIP